MSRLMDDLCKLLEEAGLELYINPFYDSKNALEFAKYLRHIRSQNLRIKKLRDALEHYTESHILAESVLEEDKEAEDENTRRFQEAGKGGPKVAHIP